MKYQKARWKMWHNNISFRSFEYLFMCERCHNHQNKKETFKCNVNPICGFKRWRAKVLKLIRLNEFYIDSLSNEMIWKMRHLSAVTAHGKRDKREKFIFICYARSRVLWHMYLYRCLKIFIEYFIIWCSNDINIRPQLSVKFFDN